MKVEDVPILYFTGAYKPIPDLEKIPLALSRKLNPMSRANVTLAIQEGQEERRSEIG